MSQPTLLDMQEYVKLREEFQFVSESSKHPRAHDLSVFSAVMMSVTEPSVRVAFDKCVRYNRYLELRTMIAPYLYTKLLNNGIVP